MYIDESLSRDDSSDIPFAVLAGEPLSPWLALAVSAVHRALHDAAMGDYNALLWLLDEGRSWLTAVGIPAEVVDTWGAKL